MKILNIEDDVFKHSDISRTLEGCGITDIDWADNLEEGIDLIQTSITSGHFYDLVISDMYYPLTKNGNEVKAGVELIEKMKSIAPEIPIVVVSSAPLRISGILGTVHFSERSDWEMKLIGFIQELKNTFN